VPSGTRHRAARTGRIPGAIKGLFREAVKALLGRDEDEPQPQERRRSGETDNGLVAPARDHKEPPPERRDSGELSRAGPAARGRYARLGETHRAVEREQSAAPSSSAAGETFGEAARAATQPIPADIHEGATAYLSDTLDWLNMWEANSLYDADELDDHYDTQQNYFSPHL